MYGDDGPDDDYMTSEQACESGWLMPDEADELRDLFRHLECLNDPTSKGLAAFILMDHILNPRPPLDPASDDAIQFQWARVKLGRHTLI